MTASTAIRIAMWSGPRNISTTMMRAFENHPDTIVADEPFYACYLHASGADHPYREETLAAMATDWREVVRALAAPLPAGKTILLEKHIAYHYLDSEPLDWLASHRTVLLIRDPRRMVASYAKRSGAVTPIVDSYHVERRIYEFVAGRGLDCPVVDAADVVRNPEAMLRALCAALDIPFTEKKLSWPAGPRPSDGPWAPHWFDAVNASTGFKPFAETAGALALELEEAASACRDDYEFLRRLRLTTG